MPERPTVTVILPVLDEEDRLDRCLDAVAAQDYPELVEVVVADGGSTDASRAVAARHERVRVVDNPRRSRPAGLNVAIAEARGEVLVRVDARTAIEPDYVRRCVEALERTGAAMVGGQMRYEPTTGAVNRGILAAMTSRLGAGPAAFRRSGGEPRFVDTVYLGAYRRSVVLRLGGYDERSGGNEDAEFAHRAKPHGGVLLDPSIRSRYLGRDGYGALFEQFRRYGRHRAITMCKHPDSIAPRQLAVPALFVALASPWRRRALAAYGAIVVARAAAELPSDAAAAPAMAAALPVMHLAWGVGFFEGLADWFGRRGRRSAEEYP